MQFTIVRAKREDAELVRQIMLEAFAELRETLHPPSSAHAETVADVERAMAEGGAILVLEGRRAVGSARYRIRPDHLYVERLSVLPTHRRKGIASLVMRYMEKLAVDHAKTAIQVGVRMSLPSNVSLYQRLGYALTDVQPHPRGPDHIGTLIKLLGG